MKSISRTIVCLAGCAGFLVAQGSMGGGMSGSGNRGGMQNSTLAMSKIQTITGTVSAVSIGYGMQYPSITLNKLQIKVAPVWYLLEKNFEIKQGDSLMVAAAPSINPSDAYLYAVEITNTVSKAHIVLRTATGLPLWSSGGHISDMGHGSGPVADGACPEILGILSETGAVEQITSGLGIQMPSLTLKTAAGKLLVIKLGPERLLAQTDLELKAGDAISIRYAVVYGDELVALTITSGGVTVTLRTDDCRPAWN